MEVWAADSFWPAVWVFAWPGLLQPGPHCQVHAPVVVAAVASVVLLRVPLRRGVLVQLPRVRGFLVRVLLELLVQLVLLVPLVQLVLVLLLVLPSVAAGAGLCPMSLLLVAVPLERLLQPVETTDPMMGKGGQFHWRPRNTMLGPPFHKGPLFSASLWGRILRGISTPGTRKCSATNESRRCF